MKTKNIIVILLCLVIFAQETKAQYIWSNQLDPPESGSSTVTSETNIFIMEVSVVESDVDIDSVADNFYTAFEEEGIDWISLSGYTRGSYFGYTMRFSILKNYGAERSICLGPDSDHCHEVIQKPYGPSIPVDWTRNWIVNVSYNSLDANTSGPVYDVSYIDGLGYENQTIQIGASTEGFAVVTPHTFDSFGREASKWLPFSYDTDGENVDNVISEQTSWYGERYSCEDENSTYSLSHFESIPSGRIGWSLMPGYDMIDNSSEYVYRTNTLADSLLRFSANPFTGELTCSGYYSPGTLRGEEFTDGSGNTAITWTDSEGRVVRIDGMLSSTQRVSTIYARDVRGNLCWVVSPEGSSIMGQLCRVALSQGMPYLCQVSSDLAKKWCFVYKRDSRGRVTDKFIPGKGRENYGYDVLDRIVSSSDSLQRSRGQSIHYEYDALGRETSRYVVSEDTGDSNPLIDTFYDTYQDSASPVVDSVYVQGTALSNPKGLKTAEEVYVIDDTLSFGLGCLRQLHL